MMKVASLIAKEKILIEERNPKSLGPTDVKINVCAAGICGSDVPRFFNGRVHFFPIVLGHEVSGVVDEVGCQVKDLHPGDHVVVVPLMPCGKCVHCAEGSYALCENYKFVGSSVDGGVAEQLVLPEKNLFKLSQKIKHKDAIFFETASVALHAVDLLGDIYGAKVAVVGTGTVGLLCSQWCRLKGAKVNLFGRSQTSDKAISLGIPYFSIGEHVNCQNSKYDFVIDAVGYSSSIDCALVLLKKGGVLSLVGTPSEDVLISSKIWNLVNRKELVIKGSWMGYSSPFPGKQWERVMQAIVEDKIALSSVLLFRQQFPLDQINDAFSLFADSKPVRGRVLIYTKYFDLLSEFP